MASIKFDITGNANGFVAATRQAEAASKGMFNNITEEGKKIDDTFKKIATSAGTFFTVQMASQFSKQVAQVRGEFQQLEVAFETMLQSKEKAESLMSQIVDTAAKTPFDLQGVANGAKQLLAYGVASEEVNDTLIRLGDIAAGLSIPLNDLVYLYGTTMTQGRLFTQDLRQFQGRGIPIAEELAKQFGVTKDAIGELVTAGKVGFPEVQKAIMAMTSEGGKFNNLMAKQSKTITGQISNLEDAVAQMFNEIGKASEGTISKAIGMASSLVENYEKVGRIIGGIVVAYGSYKAALVSINTYKKAAIALETAHAVAQRATAVSGKQLTTATVLLAKAQKALNASMLANPYVLAAAAVAALGVGIYKLVTAKSKEEKAFDSVNKQLKQYSENLDKQKQQLQELFDSLNNPESTDMQRVLAMEQLRELFPSILKDLSDEELLKLSAAEATKKLTEENEKLLRQDIGAQIVKASQKYDEAMQKINGYKNRQSDAIVKSYQKDSGYTQALKDVDKYRAELTALLNTYKDLETAAKKAEFIALPADQKIISLKESNAQLDSEIYELDKKLKELHDKKKLALVERPQEFSVGYTGGFLYQGQSEEDILAEIKARQQQKALNEKDIAENQAKVDADNKVLSEKQKKANYDRQKAKEKAEKEFEKLTRDLNYKIAQADIDSMEDGYAKTVKQLEFNLQKENDAIQDQKEELLKKKYNDELQSWLAEDAERKAYDFKFTATLTPEEKKLFEEMGKFAQNQFDKGFEEAGEKWEKEARFFKEQLKIDAMSAGAEKDEAQRQLDNEKELHNLELQRDAYIEAAHAAHLFAVAKGEASGEFDKEKANEDFNNLVAGVQNRQNEDKKSSDQQDMLEYLKQYGSFEKKKEAITEQYNDRIAKATSEGMKLTLKAEMDATLKSLEQTYNKAYQDIFKDPTKMSRASIKAAIALAQSEIKKIQDKGNLSENDLGDIERLQQAIDKLQGYSDSSFWSNFGAGMDGVIAKTNQLLSLRKRIQLAQESGDKKALKAAQEEQLAVAENLKQNLIGTGVDLFVSALGNAAASMKEIAKIAGDVELEDLANSLDDFSGFVGSVATGAATGGWIGAIVGGVTSIFGMISESLVNTQAELIEAKNNALDFANALRLAALEIDRDEFTSVFGTNEILLAADAVQKYQSAIDAYNEQTEFFKSWGGKLQTYKDIIQFEEQIYKQSQDSVASFVMYLGADGIRDQEDALLEYEAYLYKDAIKEGLDMLQDMRIKTFDATPWQEFWGTKSDQYTRLIDLAPELWGPDGVFDTKKAQLFLDTNTQLTKEQRDMIQNYIDLADAAKEAERVMEEWVSSFVGDTATSLADAIFDAIDSGSDAWTTFEEKGAEVMRSLGKQMLVSTIQEDLTTVWSERLKEAAGDPEKLAREYDDMMSWLQGRSEMYANVAKDWENQHGVDSTSSRSAVESGIAQASQASVDELNGRMTAIQSHTFSINQQLASVVNISTQILARVVNIESNTSRLEAIEDSLKNIGSEMSDIVTKGIRVRS